MSDYLQVILWFFLIEILGLISIPLAGNAGSRLADRGVSAAKTLGIILVAYFSWVFSYIWGFNRTTILISFLVLCLLSIGLYRKHKIFPERKVLLINELVFLTGFFFFLLVRVYLPKIYMHEKFMDFAFLNAVIRTSSFPPADPWFSGGFLDFYYYFGYLSVGALGKLSAVNPAILFNLAVALTFALSFNLFFGIGYNLTHGKIRYGLLTAGSGMLLGNLQGLIEFVSMYVLKEPVASGYYWSSSRVIPFTINEFPYFTFIHGDLHSHMLAIPFQLLVLLFLLNIYFRKSEKSIFENSLAFITFSIALGFLFPSNSWDFPVYFGLALSVIFVFYYGHYIHNKNLFGSVAEFFKSVILVSFFSFLLYLPFYLSFNPHAARGFDFVVPELRTTIDKFLILFGLFLFLIFSFLVTRLESRRKIGFFILFVGASALLSLTWSIPLLAVLLPLLALSLFLFLKELPERSATGFVFLLIATAAFIALLCEIVYLDDPFSGDFARMNTVFKFYMHLWVFLAIAASYSYYELRLRYWGGSGDRMLLKGAYVKKAWTAVLVLLVISCAVFPVVATFTRIKDMNAEPALDGMEYMNELDRGDYNAIRWMQKNIEGSPVVLEASEDASSYTYTSRVSANTGLPTVIGWASHEWFWGRNPKEVEMRITDVRSIYSTGNEKKTLELMDKYNISYVYIGKLERQMYRVNLDKFENETYFELVFRDSVLIYKLKKNM
ncbi:hypothetical protein MSLAZ_0489 [Methanosarcina lacustris Z-7289]|uniref:Chlor_Arch_YYY domain protein n=1 Tax=Methanosarcina lacustris Z-7289 TaxID=1434111 RepID=A0A0E3WSW9_9EURY|nr:DUF2298 domain-containing protein [Methanosarcina lacustris]AKB73750.1 hypothetical protein MSLAZ_0489 [Methanosarcina lacustris Z-7289]